jgi:histidyl-tRNA synthetase
MSDKGVTKNLDFADKMGIKYSIIVGSNELKDKKVQLKNMISGEAMVLTLAAAIKELKKEVKLVS